MDAIDALPELYRPWVRHVLEAPLPAETKATCNDCPLQEAEPPAETFGATKCCTFHPQLPSFQVGVFFRGADPRLEAGRRRLVEKIRERVFVTPLGIGRPRAFARAFEDATFGKSSLVCPYYEGGGCSVWAGREATCATWYCKHDRGIVGRRFWEALRRWLQVVERALTHWCVVELAFDGDAIEAMREPLTDEMTPDRYERMWGSRRFAEHAVYAASHEAVAALSPARVLELAGARLHTETVVLEARYRELLDPAPPEEGELVPLRIVKHGRETSVVQGYSPYDLLEIPRDVLDRATDGTLTPEERRRLADFGLLG